MLNEVPPTLRKIEGPLRGSQVQPTQLGLCTMESEISYLKKAGIPNYLL